MYIIIHLKTTMAEKMHMVKAELHLQDKDQDLSNVFILEIQITVCGRDWNRFRYLESILESI